MRSYPSICKSTDDIRSALQTMRDARVRRLPVISEADVLEGILSVSDIVLSARQGLATAGTVSGIAPGDLVTALQAIYAPTERMSRQSAAA
jgi:CBS domain-containing protein